MAALNEVLYVYTDPGEIPWGFRATLKSGTAVPALAVVADDAAEPPELQAAATVRLQLMEATDDGRRLSLPDETVIAGDSIAAGHTLYLPGVPDSILETSRGTTVTIRGRGPLAFITLDAIDFSGTIDTANDTRPDVQLVQVFGQQTPFRSGDALLFYDAEADARQIWARLESSEVSETVTTDADDTSGVLLTSFQQAQNVWLVDAATPGLSLQSQIRDGDGYVWDVQGITRDADDRGKRRLTAVRSIA